MSWQCRCARLTEATQGYSAHHRAWRLQALRRIPDTMISVASPVVTAQIQQIDATTEGLGSHGVRIWIGGSRCRRRTLKALVRDESQSLLVRGDLTKMFVLELDGKAFLFDLAVAASGEACGLRRVYAQFSRTQRPPVGQQVDRAGDSGGVVHHGVVLTGSCNDLSPGPAQWTSNSMPSFWSVDGSINKHRCRTN